MNKIIIHHVTTFIKENHRATFRLVNKNRSSRQNFTLNHGVTYVNYKASREAIYQ